MFWYRYKATRKCRHTFATDFERNDIIIVSNIMFCFNPGYCTYFNTKNENLVILEVVAERT